MAAFGIGSSAGSGTSARSVSVSRPTQVSNASRASGKVNASLSSASLPTQISSALDQIYQITDRNSARSEQQAALLRDWQERQNRIAMDFNAAEAAKNRDWQQMMSNTAHQREIKDLQAAGLNPVLSAMGGNGAAVTSGATASGVTSSGAMGQTDTSASQGLVQLLGTLWSAQTQLESQRLNAQNNLAIAEKNNSTSRLVAEMYTNQSREAAQLAADTSLKQSQISAAVSELVSRINANASYYSANANVQSAMIHSEATKVVAELQNQLGHDQINANNRNVLVNGIVDLAQTGINAGVTLRGQNVSSQTAKDVAQMNQRNSFTGTVWQAADWLESLGGNLFSGLRSGISSRGSSHESGRDRRR